MQIEPPGINMIYLPYADDIRTPELDPSFVGAECVRASEDQIELAEAMLAKLILRSFSCYDIPNPGLQRHFQASSLCSPCILLTICLHCVCLCISDSVHGPLHLLIMQVQQALSSSC